MTGEVAMNVKEEARESNGPNNDNQGRNNDQGSNNLGNPNRRGGGGNFSGRGGKFNGSPRKSLDPKIEGQDNQERDMRDSRDNRSGGMGGRGGFGGRGRGHRGGGGGGPNRGGGDAIGPRNVDNAFLNERLLKMMGGPTADLPTQELREKKFNGRCRLYVGNLPNDITEDEFKKLFESYGETSEVYINKEKNFAFIRLDYRSTAEKAKRELDGHLIRNRNLRVRFAPLGATVKVKNLSQYVTNELLEMAFSVFGEVERAVVNVDDRGNSLREGVVEFSRKGSAQSAMRYCAEACYFLTSSLKPVILEPYEPLEDNDGFSEKGITKKTQDYFEAREVGPRFAKQGSFEHEFGTRWKQIYELFRQKEEALKREMKLEEEKLEAQLQYAKYEHETEVLREQLRQRELDRERQKREWEMKERQAEEQRVAEEEALRRQQEDLSRRMLHQDDELRRRQQENSLFMQDRQLFSLLNQQESSMRQNQGYSTGTMDPNDSLRHYDSLEPEQVGLVQPSGLRRLSYPSRALRVAGSSPSAGIETCALGQRQAEANYMESMSYPRGGMRYEGGRGDGGGGGRMEEMGSRRPSAPPPSSQQGGGRWGHQERRQQPDDFPNKRRRY